jgi:hypothetical protein
MGAERRGVDGPARRAADHFNPRDSRAIRPSLR